MYLHRSDKLFHKKNCLQNFEHPYMLSFMVTSALLFSTLLTVDFVTASTLDVNIFLGCILIGKVIFSESWFQAECRDVVEVNG